ncbi:MAG: iron complex outermembrane receptor protein, partial [Saprospiraceae bacterium]
MKVKNYTLAFLILTFLLSGNLLFGQTTIKGKVVDKSNREALIGANIVIMNDSFTGVSTDVFGEFKLITNLQFPITIKVSYTGYEDLEKTINNSSEKSVIKLVVSTNTIEGVEIVVNQDPDTLQKLALAVAHIGRKDIIQNSGLDISDLMGKQPGIDVQTGSIAFKIVNTRGFNSNSPVRMLSIIDGVDNQSPGLNFSLGTFLGSSELDISSIMLISGASSPFYGPNAF